MSRTLDAALRTWQMALYETPATMPGPPGPPPESGRLPDIPANASSGITGASATVPVSYAGSTDFVPAFNFTLVW